MLSHVKRAHLRIFESAESCTDALIFELQHATSAAPNCERTAGKRNVRVLRIVMVKCHDSEEFCPYCHVSSDTRFTMH